MSKKQIYHFFSARFFLMRFFPRQPTPISPGFPQGSTPTRNRGQDRRSRGRHRRHGIQGRLLSVKSGLLGLLLALLGLLGLGLMGAAPAPGETVFNPLALEIPTPPGVRSLLPSSSNNLTHAPVYLDGRVVFHVAAPPVDEQGARGLTAQERALEIERRLDRIAQTRRAPQDITLTRDRDEQSNQPIIAVNGDVLLSVTSLDAELSGAGSLSFRAMELSQDVRRALTLYYQQRQRPYLWQQARWGVGAIAITLVTSGALVRLQKYLRRSYQHRQQASQEQPGIMPATVLRQTLLNRHDKRMYTLQQQGLRLLQGALWLGLGFFFLGLYPQSRWLQPVLVALLRLPLRILVIVAIAYGLMRLSEDWLERIFLAMQEQAGLTQERSQRLALRLSTFSEVIKGITATTIFLSTLLIILTQLGVQIGPLVAGAGILGIAVSLASQSLIKDLINGFLILLEDQYGVGDVIVVGDVAGFVETMNLRITQLRNEEGRLITVPNGHIAVVQNLSKEWSRVDLMIPVGLGADLDQALAVVDAVAQTMGQDGIWGSLILEPPLLLGVENLDHGGATIRLWIKTKPLKQWDVAREYRRRLKRAFEEAYIPIGIPQQKVILSTVVEPRTDRRDRKPLEEPV